MVGGPFLTPCAGSQAIYLALLTGSLPNLFCPSQVTDKRPGYRYVRDFETGVRDGQPFL